MDIPNDLNKLLAQLKQVTSETSRVNETWASGPRPSPGAIDVFLSQYNLDSDVTIERIEITKDGEEYFGYGGRGGGAGQQQDQQQQQDNNGEQQNEEQVRHQRSGANISWSKDSKKFAVVRSDQRKVKPLWVISSLANPRPTLETYKYAMPGDVDYPPG